MPDTIRSPLADFHLSQGATLGEYHGAVVPARFSEPTKEHHAVRTGSGLLDLSFRSKFAVKGRDAVKFLHRMVSNDVKSLSPGRGTYATLLNAQGHILADMRIFLAGDRLFVDTDADLRPKLMNALGRYIIGDRVELEPLDLAAIGLEGPTSRDLLEKTLHIEIPRLEEFGHFADNYAGFPVRVVRASSTGENGCEVWIEPKGMAGLWGAACGQGPTYGTLPCGTDALEMLRIEAGIPRYGAELAEDTLPLEAGLLNALSFTKGCYVGQEIVERARSRGHVNWRLVGLVVDSAAPPPAGEKLVAGDKEIGEVTSACVSPSLGKTVALAYVRREFSEPGARLSLVSGAHAQVEPIPFHHAVPSPS